MENIVSSILQTKEWRKNTGWYLTGKSNECEKFQITQINRLIFPNVLSKCFDRINMDTMEIQECKSPLKHDYGYEFTENFDGKLNTDNGLFYFNFKFVCGDGGSQTRTLREVYHFIRVQIEILIKENSLSKPLYFINILDGDSCNKGMKYFNYLLQKDKFKEKTTYVFIGDLFSFQKSKIYEKIICKL